MKIKFHAYPAVIKSMLLIYLIGFATGTTTHIIELIKGSFLPYTFAPLWKNIYWTSLTFLDFTAVILILTHLKPALVLSVLIIISDVAINAYNIKLQQFDIIESYRFVFQFALGIYILTTAPGIMLHYKRTKNITLTIKSHKHFC